ncbi:MAG TPA: ATP-binding protein [Rudaea sp.]
MAGNGEGWRGWLRGGRGAPPATWNFRVERERGAVGRLNDTLERTLLPAIPETALRALQVALDELLTNVIMHAEQAAGAIEVEIAHSRSQLDTRIRYIADEFDPTRWQSTPHGMTIAASQIGGLGLQLVRSLMDEFRHEYADGMNVVSLKKRC